MRTQRQRNVITSLINRFKSSSLTELNKLIDTVLPLVSTDLGNLELIRYAAMALTMELGDPALLCNPRRGRIQTRPDPRHGRLCT